jgi:hypothetical protein
MKSSLRITLNASPEQAERLKALQSAFAQVCNELAPLVRSTRCWNRVTLHHLAYKQLREKFPQMGSQMVCNAIYSVSRTARILFQDPISPFHLSRLQGRSLPSIKFADTSPVYFDRHTLSLKDGTASLYTLDGRMRFLLALSPADEKNFHERKLREIVLAQNPAGDFQLTFWFIQEDEQDDAAATKARAGSSRHKGTIPDYVKVEASA